MQVDWKLSRRHKKTKEERVVAACILCSDFERNKYIVQSAMTQDDIKYDLLVVGNREDVPSFEELFSILNYPRNNVRKISVWFQKAGYRSAVYEKYVLNHARDNQYNKIVLLRPNIAFYDASSLNRLVERFVGNGGVLGGVCVVTPEGRYLGTENTVGNIPGGPICLSVSDIQLCDETFGQYAVKKEDIGEEIDTTKEIHKNILRVVFFCREYSSWTSLQTLYEAMQRSERTVPNLVYVPGYHDNADMDKVNRGMENYLAHGYDIVAYDSYSIQRERPDIAVFVVPYSNVRHDYTIDEVSKVVRRCIYIPYYMLLKTPWRDLNRLRYKIAMIYLAWIVFFSDSGELEDAKLYAYGNTENFAAIGSPRVDVIRSLTRNSYPPYRDKIDRLAAGRTIVLWNTHHSFLSEQESFGTWKQFGMEMFSYFKVLSEQIFVIWRPHPLFWKALEKYMGKDEANLFWDEVRSADNFFLDEEETYLSAFSMSDILVSDGSGMAKEFLYTGKPVLVIRSEKAMIENVKPQECLYLCDNMSDVSKVLDNLLHGKNTREQSQQDFTSFIPTGQNVGETMLEYILNKYDSEFTMRN